MDVVRTFRGEVTREMNVLQFRPLVDSNSYGLNRRSWINTNANPYTFLLLCAFKNFRGLIERLSIHLCIEAGIL